ncbi:hypothetical protein [Streptomyces sp. NPDC058657]|uniref:SbtR family transcriptional regulator n=1 Tax=unclassified Streptomyces TaxID=2593676 RepID=UPI00366931E4
MNVSAPPIGALITRAQQSGCLRDDVEPTDTALIQTMLGTITLNSYGVAPDLWKRYLTLVLDGLRHSRDEPTPLSQRGLAQQEFDQTMR